MPRPPSTKQLGYLKGLGYPQGTLPETSGEASKLIDQLKSGMSPVEAEQRLVRYRDELTQRRLRETKEYLRWLAEMNKGCSRYPTCSGFRITVDKDEAPPESHIYHKAFLLLEVACKHPTILLIPGLDFDELMHVPRQGNFIIAPGQIAERAKGSPCPVKRTRGSYARIAEGKDLEVSTGCAVLLLAGVAAVMCLAMYALLGAYVLIVMLIAGASVMLWMFMAGEGGEGGEGGESEARQIEKIFQFQIVEKQEHAEPDHWFHVKHWESPYFLRNDNVLERGLETVQRGKARCRSTSCRNNL